MRSADISLKFFTFLEQVLSHLEQKGRMLIVQSESDPSSVSLRAAFLCLLQLFLDPYYCTVEGMCTLIEKEFAYYLYAHPGSYFD